MVLDLLIISIVILMFYLGMKKGFVKEAFNLIKFMVIIYLVPKFADIVMSLFVIDMENTVSKYLIYICSFIFLYILLTIAVSIISIIIFLFFIILLFTSDKSENIKNLLESSRSIEYISIYLGPYNNLFPEYISVKLDEFNMYSQEKQYKRSLLKNIEKRGLDD